MSNNLQKKKDAAQSVSTLGGFLAGSMAACAAVTFTNPIELIKTRMQLQGELSKVDTKVPKLYKNPLQAFGLIYKREGIRGLQQGLSCAYLNQIALNGCRLGLYEPSRYYISKWFDSNNFDQEKGPINQKLWVNLVSGSISGSIGAVIASPVFLIKTRMQSYSSAAAMNAKETAVNIGEQTYYTGTWDGLKKVYKGEGVAGFFRGMDAAVMRTSMGSAAQLPTYNYAKRFLLQNDIVKDNSFGLHLLASSAAGLAVAIVMNPGDVILTRIYNQKGNLYKGPVDCFVKTVKAEGVSALYKGFWAQLFRIGPHSILCLMFMEHTMKLVQGVELKLK